MLHVTAQVAVELLEQGEPRLAALQTLGPAHGRRFVSEGAESNNGLFLYLGWKVISTMAVTGVICRIVAVILRYVKIICKNVKNTVSV